MVSFRPTPKLIEPVFAGSFQSFSVAVVNDVTRANPNPLRLKVSFSVGFLNTQPKKMINKRLRHWMHWNTALLSLSLS